MYKSENLYECIRLKPNLHSKLYQFEFPDGDSAGFVGSANFTIGGFERNDETVAYFRNMEDNTLISKEFDRLNGHGSIPFIQWKALNRKLQRGGKND